VLGCCGSKRQSLFKDAWLNILLVPTFAVPIHRKHNIADGESAHGACAAIASNDKSAIAHSEKTIWTAT
jgi:hypothetical protein